MTSSTIHWVFKITKDTIRPKKHWLKAFFSRYHVGLKLGLKLVVITLECRTITSSGLEIYEIEKQ